MIGKCAIILKTLTFIAPIHWFKSALILGVCWLQNKEYIHYIRSSLPIHDYQQKFLTALRMPRPSSQWGRKIQTLTTSYVVIAEHTEYSEFCPHRRFKIASPHHTLFLNATQALVSSNVLVKILLLCLDLVLQLVHALCPHQHRHHALHLALQRSILSSARNY